MERALVSLNLSQLVAGDSAKIVEMPTVGTAFLRLREMGLLPGTKVKLIRKAPLGDPLEISVRGYNLSLRGTEASAIQVERVEGA
ncbi:MAG TPA: FeoA family protein [Opitutaceae bacterium]|nr:FeoA family protein [Opitutaceae bacterium]